MIGLFKKWIDGAVTWEEEKKLRTQAETDPFLADALEGYDTFPSSNHAKTLANIQQKIQQQPPKKKKKTVPYLRRAIAASVILAASASLFWWTQDQAAMSTLSEKSVSMLEKARQPTMDNIEAEENIVSIVTDKQEMPTAAILPTDQQTVVSEAPKQADVSTSTTTNPAIPANRAIKPAASIALEERKTSRSRSTTPVPSPSSDPIVAAPTYTPPPPATAIKQEEVDGAAPIETPIETAANVVMEEETVKQPSTESTVPIEQATEIALADAPIKEESSYDTAKKARTTAPSYSESLDMIVGSSSPIPPTVEILEIFKQYVRKNINYPEAARKANIKGIVQLKFEIKSDGTPKNIKVVKGLGFGCEEEAIRLLKEGPKWLYVGKEGQCEIVFE